MRFFSILVLVYALASGLGLNAYANDRAGEVGELIGIVEVQHKGSTAWVQLRFGDPLLAGDVVQTQAGAKVKVIFLDQSVITIGPTTKFRIDESVFKTAPTTERSSVFSLISGKARAMVSSWFTNMSQNKFEIRTPSAVAGVRGTEFVVSVDAKGNSEVVVLDGVVEVYNRKDKNRRAVFLGAGMSTKVGTSTTPSTPKQLNAEQLKKVESQTDIDSSESSESDTVGDDALLDKDDDQSDNSDANVDNELDNDDDDDSFSEDDDFENDLIDEDSFNRNSIPNQDVQTNTDVRINVDFK